MDEWNNSTYFIWLVWELNEVTMVFIIVKGWHFYPFLHVRQTLYTVPHWHAYFTGEERASEDLRLSRWLSFVSLHMAESLMTVASTCGDLFSWHTNSGRWWLLGSPQQLGSTRLAPCTLCSGCSKVSKSLGQHVCIPRRKTVGGTVSFCFFVWKTDSRNLFQISASLSLISPVQDAPPRLWGRRCRR